MSTVISPRHLRGYRTNPGLMKSLQGKITPAWQVEGLERLLGIFWGIGEGGLTGDQVQPIQPPSYRFILPKDTEFGKSLLKIFFKDFAPLVYLRKEPEMQLRNEPLLQRPVECLKNPNTPRKN